MTRRAAVLLASVTATAICLTGCADDESATDAGDPTSTAPSPTSSSPAASPSSEPTDPSQAPSGSAGAPADTTAAPVYLVGETPQGPRLYREFTQVPSADPLLGAAQALTSGTATDPDYRSLLTGLDVTAVTASPEEIAVTVGAGSTAEGLSRRQARLGAQSLVYTLQGAAQSRARVYVRTADGAPAPVLGIDTTDGLRQAEELDVLALVNVTTPEEGAAVSGTFTAEGVASSFEGTVPWRVLDASGTAVAEGFATAEGYVDGLYPWTSEVDVSGLAPGTYTFVASTADASEGEGAGPTEDTKTITVQ